MSPIVPSAGDVLSRLSGGASNTSPAASLGGAMSSQAGGIIVSAVIRNLFDDVSGDESAAGDAEYRCFYIVNAHATLTWLGVKAWVSLVSDSPDTEFDIGLDPAAVGSNSAISLGSEQEAPTGITFSRPTSKSAGLTIGDVPPGARKAVWLRRTVTAGASAFSNDRARIAFEGDSSA